MDDPVFYAAAFLACGCVMWMWWRDYQAWPEGQDAAGRLPGAVPASGKCLAIAVVGALGILAVETGGEYALGTVEQQTDMTALFALYSLAAAPLIEELIFRGFLYYDKGSRLLLIVSVVAISAAFALLHQYMWSIELPKETPWWEFYKGTISLKLDADGNLALGGVFSTVMKFVASLWFYYVLFFRLNRKRSLLPCFAAHAAFNFGVIVIKAAQGKTSGWY